MRLVFDGADFAHILDQVTILLRQQGREDGGLDKQERSAFANMVAERDARLRDAGVREEGLKLDVKNLRSRIKELEGHLAHATGTRDLEILSPVKPATKLPDSMPDTLKEAIKIATEAVERALPSSQRVSSTLLDDDVDKAVKPAKDLAERQRRVYPAGYWRLSDVQHRVMNNTNVTRFGQMPNGDWIVVIT